MRKVSIGFVCDLMGQKQVVPLEGVCGLAAILTGVEDTPGQRNPIVVMAGEQYEHIALAAGVLRGLLEHEGPEAVERCLELYRTCEVREGRRTRPERRAGTDQPPEGGTVSACVKLRVEFVDDEGERHISTVECDAILVCVYADHLQLGGKAPKVMSIGEYGPVDQAMMLASIITSVRHREGEFLVREATRLGLSDEIVDDPMVGP